MLVRSPRCPKDLELYHFMVTAAKVAFGLHTPPQSLLVGENKVQHSTSHHQQIYHLEVIINALQEAPGLLMPSCVVPPNSYWEVEASHEDTAVAIYL